MFASFEPITDVALSIETELGLTRGTEQHKTAYSLCVMYALKEIGAATFQAKIKALTGIVSDTFRNRLIQSVYVLRNLKAYVINLAVQPKVKAKVLALKYEITKTDIKSCIQLRSFINERKFEEKIFKRVCNLTQLDKRLESIILDIKKFCDQFVRRKLTFVLRSCNLEVHDLTGEMMCKAITTYYHTSMDCRSKLHTANFLRRTCKNHGTNMINYFTAKKRSRLNQVGDGEFSLTMVSENQLNSNSEDGESMSYETLGGTVDSTSEIMLNISIRKLIDCYTTSSTTKAKSNARKIKFIRLLMGHYDQSFSEFLHRKGIKYSNDEYIDRIKPSRYTDLVAEYLEFNRVNYLKFLNSLRQQLA